MSEDKEQTLKICKGECHLPWNQWFKRGVFTIFAIAFLAVTIFFLIALHKGSISVESVLSIILALFSMSMSAFFYFKADEAGKDFYKSSYRFMKKQSQFLGEMNARFGEKFDNLTDHIKSLQKQKDEVVEEIQENQTNTQENNEGIISALKNKNEKYKILINRLEKELVEKNIVSSENEELKKLIENTKKKEESINQKISEYEENLQRLNEEKEALEDRLEKIYDREKMIPKPQSILSEKVSHSIIDNIRLHQNISKSLRISKDSARNLLDNGNCADSPHFNLLFLLNCCDEKGKLTQKGIKYLKSHLR